ncbi:Gypsy retrotransposon integrase-like protein 1 [Balamuthia mandrillaris]
MSSLHNGDMWRSATGHEVKPKGYVTLRFRTPTRENVKATVAVLAEDDPMPHNFLIGWDILEARRHWLLLAESKPVEGSSCDSDDDRVTGWPGIHKDVERWVKGCVECQEAKAPRKKAARLLGHIIANEPGELGCMELIGELPLMAEGY